MHRTKLAVAICLTALVAACGNSTVAAPPPAGPRNSAAQDIVIPEGTYAVTVTRAQALAEGFTDAQFTEALGSRPSAHLQLKLVGGQWAVSIDVTTEGVPEIGDKGTYRTVNGSRLELTSSSEACGGCTQLLDVRSAPPLLTLHLVDPEQHTADERLVLEHQWQRQP